MTTTTTDTVRLHRLIAQARETDSAGADKVNHIVGAISVDLLTRHLGDYAHDYWRARLNAALDEFEAEQRGQR